MITFKISNMETKMIKPPSLVELYEDRAMAERKNELAVLLNQPPKKDWCKPHPVATGVKYIPIERIEYLLTSIFLCWRVEILDSKLLANSVMVTVRLHYQDPVTGQWSYHDGIGASPLQTDKGAGAIEFDKIKNNAVMLAAPAAESYAVKDAAEKIGKIFGKDLNRKDEINYNTLSGRFANPVENLKKEIYFLLKGYSGADKEEITERVKHAIADETFTPEFAEEIMYLLTKEEA